MGSRSEKGANGAECRLLDLNLDDSSLPVPENLVRALQHVHTVSKRISEVSLREIEIFTRQYESWLESKAKLAEEKTELASERALMIEERKKAKELGEMETKKLAARETRIVTLEQDLKKREVELIKRESSFEEFRDRFELEVAKTRGDREENARRAELLKQRETECKESEDDLIGREEEFRCRMERKSLEVTERSELVKQKEMAILADRRLLEEEQADLASRRIWIQEQIRRIVRFHEETWPRLRRLKQAEMEWMKKEDGHLSQWLEKKEDFFITEQIRASHNELTPVSVRSEGRKWFGNVFAWKGSGGRKPVEPSSLEEIEQEFGAVERVVDETMTITTTTTNVSGQRKPPSPSEPLEHTKRQKIVTTTTTIEANPAQAPAPAPATAPAPTPAVETGEAPERTLRARKRKAAT